jgi:hypothetical protein
MCCARSCPVVEVAAGHARHGRVEAAVADQHLLRRVLREAAGLVDQMLVGTALPPRMPASAVTMHLRLRVVDARREARRGKAAEHDRVDGADARAGEHREHGLGHHRHVDEHAVAVTHAQALEHGREAVHLGVQLAVRVARLLAGLGRQVGERRLVAARRQVPVHGVVAEVRACRRRTNVRTAAANSRGPPRTASASRSVAPARPRSLPCRRWNGGKSRRNCPFVVSPRSGKPVDA